MNWVHATQCSLYFDKHRKNWGGVVGWWDGAGILPVPRRPTILIPVGQGPTVLAVGAGGGCLDIFNLIYPFSPLSPSLGDGPI